MTDNPIDLNNYAIPIKLTEKIDDVIYFENNPHSGFLILESHPNNKPKLVKLPENILNLPTNDSHKIKTWILGNDFNTTKLSWSPIIFFSPYIPNCNF